MSYPIDWPTFCDWPYCTDPNLRPHHHHLDEAPTEACTCGDVEEPGTRPKD